MLGLGSGPAMSGCVEPSHGSWILADLYRGFGPAAAVEGAGPLESPHYELWATIREDAVVRLLPFQIVPVVDPGSPCLYYDEGAAQALNAGRAVPGFAAGEAIMAPVAAPSDADPPELRAIKADKIWLQQRVLALATEVWAVTSVSDGRPGHTDLDAARCPEGPCWLDDAALVPGSLRLTRDGAPLAPDACNPSDPAALPAPGKYCLEPSSGRLLLAASERSGALAADYRAHVGSPAPKSDPLTWAPADRLRVCAAAAAADRDFYIGNALQLTAAKGGQFYGLVDSLDPTAGLALGGITILTPYGLDQATELFVTVEDHAVGAPDPAIADPVDPAHRGPVVVRGALMRGGPTSGRGLVTADLAAPVEITIGGRAPGGHISLYVSLDADGQPF